MTKDDDYPTFDLRDLPLTSPPSYDWERRPSDTLTTLSLYLNVSKTEECQRLHEFLTWV